MTSETVKSPESSTTNAFPKEIQSIVSGSHARVAKEIE
jgi:hypothetical protein